MSSPLFRVASAQVLACVTLAVLVIVSGVAGAQTLGDLTLDAEQAPVGAEQLLQQELVGDLPSDNTRADSELQPFGARLFQGGFTSDREDGLNPHYEIQPGDRIQVRTWGAFEFDELLVVDAQGNIFIPRVGPVSVGGVANQSLDQRVVSSVRSVFTDNVQVYTSLQGAQPVAVFVTGYVPRPGRFSGIPSNSILYFIDQAGGIDPLQGSYRDVTVRRDGAVIATADIYDFLLNGELPRVQFRDGDTIVIGQRQGVVSVSGVVPNPASFEFLGASISGDELVKTSLAGVDISHAAVSGTRDNKPFSSYVPLAEFRKLELLDGDRVHLTSDRRDSEIVVEIEGAYVGPSRYAVPNGTRLKELLDHVEVELNLADIDAISIRRQAVAQRQKAALEESLRRLESQYLTAASRTDIEARIRTQEAALISEFVKRAGDVEPSGRVVIAREDGIANVLLEPGDVITIPRKSESVLLSGEVLIAQAMLHQPGLTARDYIKRAGGFGNQAKTDRIVVVRANGEVIAGKNPAVRPGDEVIVLPKIPVKNLQLAATIVDIVYKIAVAAAVAVNL